MSKPCDCGAPGAYDYTSADGDYSMCEECYETAQRQQEETEESDAAFAASEAARPDPKLYGTNLQNWD